MKQKEMTRQKDLTRGVCISLAAALALFLLLLAQLSIVVSVGPSGADVTPGTSETAPSDAAGTADAQAGNVTELNIFGYSTTQTWQGYFGNVSGTIQLANGNDDVLYNWTVANPQGEIYASTNNSVTWTSIQCFNFTAEGNHSTGGETAGATSLYGTNLTQLEDQYGVNATDVDGVDETFTLQDHDLFYTSSLEFSANECLSTRVFGDTGEGVDSEFEEVLLYEPETTSVVFASLLEQDLLGFDDNAHDFEMLVLEDGHGTDTSTTTYYFYVELE